MKTYLKILIVIISLTFSSCASGGWKTKDVALLKRTWRQCSERLDGDLANKGFCRHKKWYKKTLLGKKYKKEIQFCAYTDMVCKRKEKIENMVLKTKDLL